MSCYQYEGTWYIRNRHFEGCDPGCDGCQTCTERHCPQCRGRHHLAIHENTCPHCVGQARQNIHALLELYAALPDEAEARGTIGEAVNLHGPVADAEALSHRRVSILAGRINAPLPEEDEHHPLAVLGRWVFMLGEDYGDPWTGGLTLSGAVDYLDRRLGRIANDVGQDFGLFAAEVRRCRVHLEAVLHDGEQRDTGAPCLKCRVPLVREWGILAAADGWRCPVCRDFRSEKDYRLNVADLHTEKATHLTDTDMETRTGVKAATVRSWARKDLVTRKVDAGRTLYSVADVETQARRAGLVA